MPPLCTSLSFPLGAAVVSSLGARASSALGGNVGIAGVGLSIDEALRAENDFLDVCDIKEVTDRLRAQAETRAER
jgi:hypothetical protein